MTLNCDTKKGVWRHQGEEVQMWDKKEDKITKVNKTKSTIRQRTINRQDFTCFLSIKMLTNSPTVPAPWASCEFINA